MKQKHTIWGLLPRDCAWLFTRFSVWAWSSLLTSVFSCTMMIIPLSRLHVCLLRKSGPERAFWVPESGTNMHYSASWGEGNILFRGYAAIPKAKYWFKPNDIYLWTLTQNSDWADASVFWAPTRANDYSSDYVLPQPYQSAFPCQLLPWNHTARRVVKALGLLSVNHMSSIATSSCYGYLS